MSKASILGAVGRTLLGPGKRVVTLLCDSGLKYLSTELYSSTTTP